MPEIISRARWGARRAAGYGPRRIGDLDRYLHHTVTKHLPESAAFAAECAQMRIIEQIGQSRFGVGISYTHVIFPSGRIYEGAGIARVSAHTGGGRNTKGAGLCLAGNYEVHTLGKPALDSLVWLLRHGVDAGWWKSPTITAAHRDFKSTSCPGKHAYAAITRINILGTTSRDDEREPLISTPGMVRVQDILRAAGYDPGPSDGIAGPRTRAAIRAYQRGQVWPTLPASGRWSTETDQHAAWTAELQGALNKWSAKWDTRLPLLRVDHDYGEMTAQRVLDWQVRNHGKAYPSEFALDGEAGWATVAGLGLRRHP